MDCIEMQQLRGGAHKVGGAIEVTKNFLIMQVFV